jgi:hypothetical protein
MAARKPVFPPGIVDIGVDELRQAEPGAARPPRAFHEHPAAAEPPPTQATKSVKETAVATTVYLLPDDHRRLRILAAERGVAAQQLVMDALDRLFEDAGLARLERWNTRRKAR